MSTIDSSNVGGEALVLNNIAWNYRVQGNINVALEYFEKSLELFERLNDREHMQGVLNNMGTAYRRIDGMKDKALAVFHKSLAINKEIGNRQWEAYNYNNIGLIHLDLKNYNTAIESIHKASIVNKEIPNLEEYSRNLLNLGLAYLENNQLDSAEVYFDQAHELIQQQNFIKVAYIYYDYQYELYLKKDDYKSALEFYQKKTNYEIAQNKRDIDSQIEEQRIKYETATKEYELEQAKNKNKQREFGALMILFISIIIFLIKLYHSKSLWAQKSNLLHKEIQQKVKALHLLDNENEHIKNNLEKLVREKTERIIAKNEKLKKYAFINSHKIRAPLARILGLINVLNLEEKCITGNIAFTKLNESSIELDMIIRNITSLLLEENSSTNVKSKN